MTLRELIRWIRAEYELEGPPLAIHEGYTHIGEGGAPRMTAMFVRYLTVPPWAVDPADPSYYQYPLRATLSRMQRHSPEDASVCLIIAAGEYTASQAVAWVAPGTPHAWRGRVAAGALEKLHRMYRERTPIPEQTSWIDKSDSQRAAEGEGVASGGTGR